MGAVALGAVAFETLAWKYLYSAGAFPEGCTSGISGGVEEISNGYNRGSRFAQALDPITEQDYPAGAFQARTQDYIGYYTWLTWGNLLNAGTSNGRQSIITSHYTGNLVSGVGAVRLVANVNGTTHVVSLTIEVESGGSWSSIGGGATIDPSSYTDIDLFALQVDLASSPAKARIMRYDTGGGSPSWHEYLTWTASASILSGGIKGTPALSGWQSGKSSDSYQQVSSCVFVYDADSIANLPDNDDGSGNDIEVFAHYPKGDDAKGSWTAVNGPAACSGDLWRVLNDPETNDILANNSAIETTVASDTYLADISATAAASVDGVYVCANGIDVTKVSHVVLKSGVTTSEQVGVAPVGTGQRYYFWATDPNTGAAWTVAAAAAVKAGCKSAAGLSSTASCKGIIVGVLGAGGARPSLPAACPSGASLVMPNRARQLALIGR